LAGRDALEGQTGKWDITVTYAKHKVNRGRVVRDSQMLAVGDVLTDDLFGA
jgi:hypothetical protein